MPDLVTCVAVVPYPFATRFANAMNAYVANNNSWTTVVVKPKTVTMEPAIRKSERHKLSIQYYYLVESSDQAKIGLNTNTKLLLSVHTKHAHPNTTPTTSTVPFYNYSSTSLLSWPGPLRSVQDNP